MTPEEKKKYRDQANRARRELLKEKEKYGHVSDGSGKRYLIPVYYIFADQNDTALDFYSWFESEFSDDIGEPIFDLYWVLAALRAGREEYARYRLQVAMIGNLYMLPIIFREPIKKLDIWHWSNLASDDYLNEAPEFLDEPTEEERQWIKEAYNSPSFSTLRDEYISTYHKLKYERGIETRRDILDKWRDFYSQAVQKNS